MALPWLTLGSTKLLGSVLARSWPTLGSVFFSSSFAFDGRGRWQRLIRKVGITLPFFLLLPVDLLKRERFCWWNNATGIEAVNYKANALTLWMVCDRLLRFVGSHLLSAANEVEHALARCRPDIGTHRRSITLFSAD